MNTQLGQGLVIDLASLQTFHLLAVCFGPVFLSHVQVPGYGSAQ